MGLENQKLKVASVWAVLTALGGIGFYLVSTLVAHDKDIAAHGQQIQDIRHELAEAKRGNAEQFRALNETLTAMRVDVAKVAQAAEILLKDREKSDGRDRGL